MKEIGGYLELEHLISNEYYKDLIAVNTARNALLYLCKAKNIEKLYIPYFLCDSISEICDRENIKYEYYNINRELKPLFNKPLLDNEYIYIVNYYGQLSDENIHQFKSNFKNLILDNVQAFFHKL